MDENLCLTQDRGVAGSNLAGKHCVVTFRKTLYPLLSTGSTQEDPSQHDWKNVDWDVKDENKQTEDINWKYLVWISVLYTLVIENFIVHGRLIYQQCCSWLILKSQKKKAVSPREIQLCSNLNIEIGHWLLFDLKNAIPMTRWLDIRW